MAQVVRSAVLATVLTSFASLPVRAAEVSEDVLAVAESAGVDAELLQGAVNTTGYLPAEYLCLVGEGPCPKPASTVWDRLAYCESHGDWHIDAYHDGGLQFAPGTWSAYKLRGYPAYAYQASREQQIAVAERVQQAQGWRAWPTCSKLLGLR